MLSVENKEFDDEDGFIGERYIVKCLLGVPNTNIPMDNMLGEQERTCLVNKKEFKRWL